MLYSLTPLTTRKTLGITRGTGFSAARVASHLIDAANQHLVDNRVASERLTGTITITGTNSSNNSTDRPGRREAARAAAHATAKLQLRGVELLVPTISVAMLVGAEEGEPAREAVAQNVQISVARRSVKELSGRSYHAAAPSTLSRDLSHCHMAFHTVT